MWTLDKGHFGALTNDCILYNLTVHPTDLVSVCYTARTTRFAVKFLYDLYVPVLQVYESRISNLRAVSKHPRLLKREEKFTHQGSRG